MILFGIFTMTSESPSPALEEQAVPVPSSRSTKVSKPYVPLLMADIRESFDGKDDWYLVSGGKPTYGWTSRVPVLS
jgi:hypothetical protein